MKRNLRSGFVAITVVVILVIGLVAFFLYQSGVLPFGKKSNNQFVITEVVKRGDLLVTVTEDGLMESAANVEVKCQVAGGSSILSIIPDGTYVKEGDKIIELDSAQLEDSIIAQQNVLESAKAAKIQAENDYNVAKISVKEYEEGTFKKELQDADTQVTIALENLRNAQNSLEHSKKMFRKGYLSKLELESQEFAVKRSQLELDSANSAKEVLINFTKAKQLEDLKSKVATSEAKMNSETRSYELEVNKLKKLESQKDNCVIYAPQSGMVVYANSKSRWGGQQTVIEEGTAVRERQAIVKIPDLTRMQVNVKVHESKVELLKPGLRAIIKVQGQELQGTVDFVANQPEQQGFMSAKVQEYSTIIAVDGEQSGLKPGMTAEATVLITHEKNVLKIPVAAVVQQAGTYYAWVDKNGDHERRELVLGASDENFVEVKDGLAEDEKVVLNPRAVIEEARGEGEESASKDGKKDVSKFGDISKAPKVDPTKRPEQKEADASKKAPGGQGKGGAAGKYSKYQGKGGGGGNFDPAMIFGFADKNKDGKLEGDEISGRMAPYKDKYDTNKDGSISKDEFVTGMKEMMKNRKQ